MIFSGRGRLHLNGRKELTDKVEPIEIKDLEYVYIPMLNMANTNADILVKEGDHVKVGQVVGKVEKPFEVPLFASVSGEVVGIDEIMLPVGGKLPKVKHVKIKNDGKFEAVEAPKALDVNKATKQEIVDAIKANGITGSGGSGFPTYIKYSSDAKIDTVIINGVECEPYITIDYKLMQEQADALVNGIKFMVKAANANNAIIAFKVGKSALKEAVSKAIANESNISIVEVPDVYPMGWERTLIKQLTGKRYKTLPSEIGLIVNNSTTAIKIGNALSGKPSYMQGVTMSGEGLVQPTNVIVPIGAKVSDIVEKIGGYNDNIVAGKARLVLGGPMMGKTAMSDDATIGSYSNAITVLPESTIAEEERACLRCSRCVDTCPAGLQPVLIKDAVIRKDVAALEKLGADTCITCGLCSFVCPSRIAVTDYTSKGKTMLMDSKK